MKRILLSLVLLLAVLPAFVCADPSASPEERLAAAKKLADGLHYQQGEITLRDGVAKINLPDGFRYLDAKDTSIVLSKIWTNPESATLGMLVPTGIDLLSEEAWVVVITYKEEGYVKDNDAATINYDKLLKQMQDSTREENQEREKEGFPSMELVGWAAPPRYDAAAHKLYWAKELRVGGSSVNTLNYCIRMLGRRGVLELNAVAGMDQLAAVEHATPSILSTVDFQEGHRYVDFKPGSDKVATYGLAALITGGILAKAGFFKLLAGFFKPIFAALIALKKLVIVGFIALIAGVKKLFARLTGRGNSSDTPT